ncbi:hypothetical protein [Beijerinckia sp. L45]|uniref:hypothetical protein n=1 Tax=Beijerinckia sp. L45 TaxID=1641855 RepID=UPI00131C74A1|nr:hypothetical protein [Beijerinckia sp. L45]
MSAVDWTTAAVTGLLTTILNQGVGWFRDWYQQKKLKETQAVYLALQLCVVLDNFVNSCIYRHWHDKEDLKDARHLDYKLPVLSAYPIDASDWKSFYQSAPKLAAHVMAFPNEIMSAESSCQFQGMREGNPFASADETIVAGMRAWELAQDIRKHFGLEAVILPQLDSLASEYKTLQDRIDFNRAFAHYATLPET